MKIRAAVLHPILFGIYPVLALLAHNLSQVKASTGLRAIIISLVGAITLYVLLKRVLRDRHKAGMIASIVLILFFSYGHVYGYFKQTEVSGALLGRHRLLVPIWMAALAFGLWWSYRIVKNGTKVTKAANLIAIAALAFPILQFVTFEIRNLGSSRESGRTANQISTLQVSADQALPDLYYIILDAYTRDDVLTEVFDFDNSPFLNRLEELGFYVARCSQSNYGQTELSLASSLNLNYLEALGENFVSGSTDRSDLWPLIRNSAVLQTLENHGYTSIAFETGYYWTQLNDVDLYLSPSTSAMDALELAGGMNSFEVMLVQTTGGLLLTDAATVLPKFLVPDITYPHRRNRERLLYNLNRIRGIPLMNQGPKFVFAHLVLPHKPFVFGPNGEHVSYREPLDNETYIAAYRDQLTFTNDQMEQMISEIISSSRTPPVIVIQGDHGAGNVSAEDRMAILNAVYLPGASGQKLYDSISPVNTFRVIFNEYFGGHFDLLEDHSYFSTYDDPYNYREIPNTRPDCEAAS